MAADGGLDDGTDPCVDPRVVTDPLAKVTGLVTALRQPPKGSGEAGSTVANTVSRWWIWPLVAVLVLVGLAISAWYGAAGRRELARLRHEEVKRRLDSEEAAVDQTLARTAAERAAAQLAEDRALLALAVVQVEVAEVEARAARDRERVAELRWGELPRGHDLSSRRR